MGNEHGLSDAQIEKIAVAANNAAGGSLSPSESYTVALAAYAVIRPIVLREAARVPQGIIHHIQTFPQITGEQVSQAFTAGVIRDAILSLIPKEPSDAN